MTDDSNNIYKLYKLVFGNNYIVNLIYQKVKSINRVITRDYKSFQQCTNYENVNFSWCVENKHWELLYYKIQRSTKFNIIWNKEMLLLNLSKFIEFIDSDQSKKLFYYSKDLLEKFYFANSNELSNINMCGYELSIKVNSLELVKLFHKYSTNDKDVQQGTLMEFALGIGNIEIIDYLHKVMKVVIKEPRKVLITSLVSKNRSKVLEYLINEIGFDPVEHNILYRLDSLPMNAIKLEFSLFKRIYPAISLGHILSINNQFNPFEPIEITSNTLNLIQCLIYYQIQFEKNNKIYLESLKKIEWLIKYNNDGGGNNWFSNLRKSKYGINLKDLNFEKQVKRIFIFEYLDFFIDQETQLNCYKMKINFIREYGEYNLIEKEFEKSKSKRNVNKERYTATSQFIQAFISISTYYGDSKLIQILLDLILTNKLLMNEYSSIQLFGTNKTENWTLNPNFDQLCKNIQLQIQNLIIFKKGGANENIGDMFQCLFRNIHQHYDTKGILTNLELRGKLDDIGSIISLYGKGLISATVLTCDFNLFKYYYEYFENSLFNFDDTIQISINVVQFGNLEFIRYLNDINLLESKSIDYCSNIEVARFMYEHLNVRFSVKSLIKLSELNEYKSGYLYYYAFDKLVDTNIYNIYKSKTVSPIQIPISSLSKYYQLDYIKRQFDNGILNNSNCTISTISNIKKLLHISDDNEIHSMLTNSFKSLLDINFIIENGNFDQVKQFFKNIKQSSIPNDEDLIILLNNNSLEKLDRVHPSFPIVSYIKNKIKDGKLNK